MFDTATHLKRESLMDFEVKKIEGIKKVRLVRVPLHKHPTIKRLYYKKSIIAFDNGGTYMVMFNPEIIKCSGAYEAEEGCLSLTGTRKAKRYRSIKVQYQNAAFQTRIKTFSGWTAQIIQHEIDHCNGVVI